MTAGFPGQTGNQQLHGNADSAKEVVPFDVVLAGVRVEERRVENDVIVGVRTSLELRRVRDLELAEEAPPSMFFWAPDTQSFNSIIMVVIVIVIVIFVVLIIISIIVVVREERSSSSPSSSSSSSSSSLS